MSSLLAQLQTIRAGLAARAATVGLNSLSLIVADLVLGVVTIPLIAMQHNWIAGAALIASAACGVLGRTSTPARWQDLSQTFDLIVLAGLPFGFALADPARAIAACFLMFGMIATVAASLFAQHLHRLDVIDRSVCIALLLLACAMPPWFSLIAYILGLAAFVAAGARISLAAVRSGD